MASGESILDTPKTRAGILFGEFLVSKNLLSRDGLIEALNKQREQGGRLGEVLLQLKMLNDEDVTYALAEYLAIEYIQIGRAHV